MSANGQKALRRQVYALFTACGVFMLSGLLCAAASSDRDARNMLRTQLPAWGYRDVDVERLSNRQVAQISNLLHSNHSPARIRGGIHVILNGSLFDRIFGPKERQSRDR